MTSQTESVSRLPGVTYAVSNTGPLISTFQSDSFSLLANLFAEIYIPAACLAELKRHGYDVDVQAASPQLVVVDLTVREESRALTIAEQIAQHSDANDPVAVNHLGEAQAIVLALRSEYRRDLLLLDELAARAVAKQFGLKISGFPGALLLAVRGNLISPEDLQARLLACRAQGTHYGLTFIRQVYNMAKQGRREK